MPGSGEVPSQGEARPEAKVSILVSPDRAPLLLKAAEELDRLSGSHTESVNDFARQNPASEKLMQEVSRVLDQAANNLAKEILEFLSADGKRQG